MTEQTVLSPQGPGHGSTHFVFWQTLLLAQLVLVLHSGWQCGGYPSNPETQEHLTLPWTIVHCEFGPQGLGLHWSICSSTYFLEHCINGFPKYPSWHIQIGLWFTTRHSLPSPQTPIHGSTHFLLKHAICWEHSELNKHSGLHEGGLPTYPGKQEQIPFSFLTKHWLFAPHGLGMHGFSASLSKIRLWIR